MRPTDLENPCVYRVALQIEGSVCYPRQAHGCQLSLLVRHRARERFAALERAGVVCDYREPDVIRVAPVPLYNTFHELWSFARTLAG